MDYTDQKKKQLAVPRPSASVVVVSPQNEILLLHRVKSSSAFPSAHVFPGGNVDPVHDGHVAPSDQPERHRDALPYRLAAIRETFEESGILLARNAGFGRLIEVSDEAKLQGRRKVHAGEEEFGKWCAAQGGSPDVDGLLPFTRWITPPNLAKRFTTQMYIYFLPLDRPALSTADEDAGPLFSAAMVSAPTPEGDGGVETTEARFRPAAEWIAMQNSGEVILFPPQLFLLSLVSRYLDAGRGQAQEQSRERLSENRQGLKQFVTNRDDAWGEVCISPLVIGKRKGDGRQILGLNKPGPELEESGRKGVEDKVVLVDFRKEGPRRVEVRGRKEVLEEERRAEGENKGKL